MAFLFPISLFLSALLLFSIQPMVAKVLLPVYGGTPAVWTVCMLFFQLILLAAYGYAWLLSTLKPRLLWRLIHVALLLFSLSLFPLWFHPLQINSQPEWEILYALLTQTGLPLLVIGASAPLLQFAYSHTKAKGASDPYFLYVASNLGSLGALLLYPWVIERFIGLSQQFYFWSLAYCVYAALLVLVLFGPRYVPIKQPIQSKKSWPWLEMLYWVFLSFIPCSLMLAVTLYISTDVAATPLFWVLPLALYLLSFVLTFSTSPLISQTWVLRNYLFVLIFTLLSFILGIANVKAWQMIVANLLSFFMLALLCHGQLFQRRPKPQALTLFYFCLATGGVLAGLFNGLLAPHWFNRVYEYPLMLWLSLVALPATKGKQGWWLPLLILALAAFYYFVPFIAGYSTYYVFCISALILIVTLSLSKLSLICSLLVLLGFIFFPIYFQHPILLQERNFYGVKRVELRDNEHGLISQSTLHSLQVMDGKKPTGDTSYYAPPQKVIELMMQQFNPLSATIIGLGAGTLLCQFRTQDQVQAIEIDEQMIAIARNPKLFTFIPLCLPEARIIKNDGRLALMSLADASQNVLILDAFNSDSIPIHLMTVEAFTLYKQKLAKAGVILVNLSNRHVNLLPVVIAAAQTLGLKVLYIEDLHPTKKAQFASTWALLTTNESLLLQLKDTNWHRVTHKKPFLWTDDYSNIIPLFKW